MKKYSLKKKHTVKWYETIDDVAAKYNVPVDAIVALNNLQTTLIKKKQQLYIPNDEFLALLEQMNRPQEPEKDPLENMDLSGEGVAVSVEQPQLQIDKELDILYILPLNLNDTIAPNSNFMDFYIGALMSMESREDDKKTNITLVDQQMFRSIDDIISTGVLENKDMIVGPVKPADQEKVLAATAGKSVVISPIDQSGEKLIEGNPLLVQIPPTVKAQQENIINLFADKCTEGRNAVIIYETGAVDTTHLRMAKEILLARGVDYSLLSYGILEGREILEKMSGYMKPETDNNVLVLSGSEAFVRDVVRNLNLIHTNPVEENRRKITLFGLPRWRNFETIEV
ncbi:MAG: LysM peptidoglycan-binding domain-containing protein, partial [Bacteroidales bacterium]|nr:LysM peptidoglycan-binding domain-containing protein [Bacteroidales bacterium]